MINPQTLDQKLRSIIDIARCAPSVHNTQPWIVGIKDNDIMISIDPKYRLTDGDPTGRQTMLSLGIFAEAVVIASNSLGLEAIAPKLSDNKAVVGISGTTLSKNHVQEAQQEVKYLKTRATDRSIYHSVPIDKQIKKQLALCSDQQSKVWILTNQESIHQIADWTAKGIGVALSNPSFREELSHYLVEPWSKKLRGISVSSLYIPRILEIIEPVVMKLGFGLHLEVELEKKRWLSSSGIIAITTAGDVEKNWFEAGKAYLRVSLLIERLGLSQATSAATVEASNFHEDVEQLLGTTQRLQAVLRIGIGSPHRKYSPRVSAEELIA